MIAKAYIDMPLSQDKLDITPSFVEMLGLVNNTDQLKKGVDAVIDLRNQIPEQYGISPVLNNMLKSVIKKKQSAMAIATDKTAFQEQIDYINAKIGEEKKGF